jgi:hypothetical protein
VDKKPAHHANSRNHPARHWGVSTILALSIAGLTPTAGNAYTAAGDRTFTATLELPQIASSDAFWASASTQPMTGGNQTEFTGTYSKMITDRLGIQLADGLNGVGSVYGASNFSGLLQYEAIINQPHEFVLSVEVGREFGGTGSQRVGSPSQSATTPAITFGKGLGDLPIGYLRPLAITGFAGYQAAEGARPNMVIAGFSVQYSIPYLVSKVANLDLPPFLRGMTPITEVLLNTPVGRNTARAASRTLVVAPGVSYTQGRGWELGIEATVPATKATGSGVGVIAQFVLQFDYLLPASIIGRPIFPPQ